MINTILNEVKRFIESHEYDEKLENIGKTFLLDEDNIGYLFGTTNGVILGEIAEENFVDHLTNRSDIKIEQVKSIYQEVKREIFSPFRTRIAHLAIDQTRDNIMRSPLMTDQSQPLRPQTPKTTPVQPQPIPKPPLSQQIPKAAPVASPTPQPQVQYQPLPQSQPQQPRPPENLTKEHILSEIENPPRTVTKRYVIEHEPLPPSHPSITDPEHLIDNIVEERPKLQDHYND